MREFVTSALEDFRPEEQKEIVFTHDGREVVFYEPGSGQAALMLTFGRGSRDHEQVANFLAMFFELMDSETARYFQSRLMNPKDPFDVDTPGGIFDMWEALIEEWSARPTREPSDYQPPRKPTGRASTASTRAAASPSSPSRSRASSR